MNPNTDSGDPTAHSDVSNSQPVLREVNKLLSRYNRTVSHRDEEIVRFNNLAIGELPSTPFETLTQLQMAVFKVLEERLKIRQVTSSALHQNSFTWSLPRSLDQVDQWRLLLSDPLSVSTQMLSMMLSLEINTADSPHPLISSNNFYIRSFTMRVRNIWDVFQSMLHDGYDMNPRIFSWMERIEALDGNTYLTLRYCGQSQNRPWDRHVSDIYSKSLKSFLGRFLKTVGMLCPDVLKNATVHTVTKATSALQLDAAYLDLREQVLIALLGDGVLNTEIGGKNPIVLVQEDRDIFAGLNTATVELLQTTDQCPATLRSKLHQYARSVRTYVEQNPATTSGKIKNRFSDTTEDMLVSQGTPRVLSDGSAVMVSLGSDLGDTHEDEKSTFFEAGGRASDAVTSIYNHFGQWENSVSSYDKQLAKDLAKANFFPFADLFPWFLKHTNDYQAAGMFIGQYIEATKPLIVLTFGSLPSYAAQQNFTPFTSKSYENDKKAAQRKFGDGHWVKNILGVPKQAALPGSFGMNNAVHYIIIPCCHPGLLGHVGILKEKLTRLLVMVLGIAWKAITYAIRIDQQHPISSRLQKCEGIFKMLEDRLSRDTPFGAAFMQAKFDYTLAMTAWTEGKRTRLEVGIIGAPPRNILPGKTERSRRPRIAQHVQTVQGVSEGFEVSIQEQPWDGATSNDSSRHRLTWKEGDGQVWSIAPIILPANVLPSDENDKRFLFFTLGGIDIRNNAGISLGDRKPITTGSNKTETLPLASLVITTSEQAGVATFFSHWEEVTGRSSNEVLGARRGWNAETSTFAALQTANEGYLPVEYFANSRSKRALPFTSSKLTSNGYRGYLSRIERDLLPANTGDLLWLIDRFFQEKLPQGGDIDLISASIHANSVYRLIATFCDQAKYKHHPHWRTLMAFVSMAEMGLDERAVCSNAMTMAAEVLRGPFTKKTKTANLTVNNEKRSASRAVLTIKGNRSDSVIYEEEEPELAVDVGIEDDLTDNDSAAGDDDEDTAFTPLSRFEGTKRGRDDETDEEDGRRKTSRHQ